MPHSHHRFSWINLYLFKRMTEKPKPKSAGPLIVGVIVVGIFILHLPWWLCVGFAVLSVFTRARG